MMGEVLRSRMLTPEKAYKLFMRFLNNPCPVYAGKILDKMNQIIYIVRQYEKMQSYGSLPSDYLEGINLFLNAFEMVEKVLALYEYISSSNSLDEIHQRGIIPRRPIC